VRPRSVQRRSDDRRGLGGAAIFTRQRVEFARRCSEIGPHLVVLNDFLFELRPLPGVIFSVMAGFQRIGAADVAGEARQALGPPRRPALPLKREPPRQRE
jgi:hypothetical protein